MFIKEKIENLIYKGNYKINMIPSYRKSTLSKGVLNDPMDVYSVNSDYGSTNNESVYNYSSDFSDNTQTYNRNIKLNRDPFDMTINSDAVCIQTDEKTFELLPSSNGPHAFVTVSNFELNSNDCDENIRNIYDWDDCWFYNKTQYQPNMNQLIEEFKIIDNKNMKLNILTPPRLVRQANCIVFQDNEIKCRFENYLKERKGQNGYHPNKLEMEFDNNCNSPESLTETVDNVLTEPLLSLNLDIIDLLYINKINNLDKKLNKWNDNEKRVGKIKSQIKSIERRIKYKLL